MNPTEKKDAKPSKEDLIEWLKKQLEQAEMAVRCREEGEKVWQSGPDKKWREVGCKMTKVERLRVADREGRIAKKCRRDVDMIKAIISMLV